MFFTSKFPARSSNKLNLSKGKSQVFSEPILIDDSLPYGETLPAELPVEDLMERFNREIPELEMTPEKMEQLTLYDMWFIVLKLPY